MIEFLQWLGLEPKSIFEVLLKIKEKRKNELTGTFTSAILVSIKEAFEKKYYGYRIKYPKSAEDFEYFIDEVEKILIKFDIKNSTDAYELSESIVKQLKEKRLITVEDKDGNENKYDLDKFYNLVEQGIKEHIETNTVSNQELINRLMFKDVMINKETQNIVKSIKEKQSESESAENAPVEKNIKVTTRELKEADWRGMDFKLDLSSYFNDKQSFKKGCNWEVVKEKIDEFVETLDKDIDYILHLKTNFSVAYYLGTKLKTKCDYSIKLYQPSDGGKFIWRGNFDKGTCDYEEFEINPIKLTGKSTAVIISVTYDIKNDVKKALEDIDEEITNIIEFKLNSNNIVNGVHANKLVKQLRSYLKKNSLLGRDNELHIFISSPISFPFILGDMAFDFYNVNVYEYVKSDEAVYERIGSI